MFQQPVRITTLLTMLLLPLGTQRELTYVILV